MGKRSSLKNGFRAQPSPFYDKVIYETNLRSTQPRKSLLSIAFFDPLGVKIERAVHLVNDIKKVQKRNIIELGLRNSLGN
jgi:hypothetical protein